MTTQPETPKPYEPNFESFFQWAREQDPERTYDYLDRCGCAFAQHLQSLGHTQIEVGGLSYTTKTVERGVIPDPIDFALIPEPGYENSDTFANLVARLERIA